MNFSSQHLKLINEAQELIQKLQKQQEMAYDVLLLNLPDDLLKRHKNMIWDYVFNNQSHTLTLNENGLRVEPIFRGEF